MGRKKLSYFLILLILTELALALYLSMLTSQHSADLSALKELTDIRQRISTLSGAKSQRGGVIDTRGQNVQTPWTPAKLATPQEIRASEREFKIRDSVAAQHVKAAKQRLKVRIAYGRFFQKSGLNPAKIEELERVLIDRQNEESDVNQAVEQNAIGMRDMLELARQAIKSENSRLLANLQAVLGPTYAQFDEYDKQLLANIAVAALLQEPGMPGPESLESQADHLVKIFSTVDVAKLPVLAMSTAGEQDAVLNIGDSHIFWVGPAQPFYINDQGRVLIDLPLSNEDMNALAVPSPRSVK